VADAERRLPTSSFRTFHSVGSTPVVFAARCASGADFALTVRIGNRAPRRAKSNNDRGLRGIDQPTYPTMTSATIIVDRELVQRSFRDWHAEQETLDAQLIDSVAALEAYQSHLDGWQCELARERDELQRLRDELGCEKVVDGADHEKLGRLEQDLYEARAKITSLTTSLLDRTEELRQLDRQRADVNTELALAKARERDLSTALDTAQKSFDVQREQWETAIAQMRHQLEESLELAGAEAPAEPVISEVPLGPIAAANPVLGSLMQQFDKLRQQRSVGRHSPTRTR
jgi:hypothetical protein